MNNRLLNRELIKFPKQVSTKHIKRSKCRDQRYFGNVRNKLWYIF